MVIRLAALGPSMHAYADLGATVGLVMKGFVSI